MGLVIGLAEEIGPGEKTMGDDGMFNGIPWETSWGYDWKTGKYKEIVQPRPYLIFLWVVQNNHCFLEFEVNEGLSGRVLTGDTADMGIHAPQEKRMPGRRHHTWAARLYPTNNGLPSGNLT